MRIKDAQAERYLEQMNNYVAPKSDKYKAELIHRKTGKIGSILRDTLQNCIIWTDKSRNEKWASRITGADIYYYNGTIMDDKKTLTNNPESDKLQ